MTAIPRRAAFTFLRHDGELMTEAREVLSSPSHRMKPFAISLRVRTEHGKLDLDRVPYMWWWNKEMTYCDLIPQPLASSWREEARYLAPLSLLLVAAGSLLDDITSLLPPSQAGDEDLHGHFLVTRAGAFLKRDGAIHHVNRDGGAGAIFPILPRDPGGHTRVAQIMEMREAIDHLLKFEDPIGAAEPEFEFSLRDYLAV